MVAAHQTEGIAINIAVILHYPQPPALSHVVGNPLAADYCNPTECLDDTSDHDREAEPSGLYQMHLHPRIKG